MKNFLNWSPFYGLALRPIEFSYLIVKFLSQKWIKKVCMSSVLLQACPLSLLLPSLPPSGRSLVGVILTTASCKYSDLEFLECSLASTGSWHPLLLACQGFSWRLSQSSLKISSGSSPGQGAPAVGVWQRCWNSHSWWLTECAAQSCIQSSPSLYACQGSSQPRRLLLLVNQYYIIKLSTMELE